MPGQSRAPVDNAQGSAPQEVDLPGGFLPASPETLLELYRAGQLPDDRWTELMRESEELRLYVEARCESEGRP